MKFSAPLPVLQLYMADIRPLAQREEQAISLLPARRREMAQAISLSEDRLLSAAAGLLLRAVLGITSDDALCTGTWGKPFLPGGPCFSLSHGGHYAVLAVFPFEVGVDIEPLRQPPRVLPVRFLTSQERNWYESEPSGERFYHLWTRLESALKTDGRGLSMAENRSFSVLESGAPWYLETFTHDGHIISCAASRPFTVDLTVLDPDTLLMP